MKVVLRTLLIASCASAIGSGAPDSVVHAQLHVAQKMYPTRPIRLILPQSPGGPTDIIGRLIERSRLLIALSEEIPVETKLQTQPLLKQLEQALAVPAGEQDEERIRGTYAALYSELADYADLEALLSALRNFVPYL